MIYSDTINIPAEVGVSDVQHMEEFLRGIGFVDAPGSWESIRFTVEADDLWDLRGLLAEVQQESAAWGFQFEPNKFLAKEKM